MVLWMIWLYDSFCPYITYRFELNQTGFMKLNHFLIIKIYYISNLEISILMSTENRTQYLGHSLGNCFEFWGKFTKLRKVSVYRGRWRNTPSVRWSGAVGETRTPTPLLKLVPETSTSTNSVTTAYWYYLIFPNNVINPICKLTSYIRTKFSFFRPLHLTNFQITDTFTDTPLLKIDKLV